MQLVVRQLRIVARGAAAVLAGLRLRRLGADQVGPAGRLSGEQLPHREPAAVRQRRRQGDRRQAEDHRARQRLAVQGQRDQARRPGRPGADRRDPAHGLLERVADLRHRRPALPRRQLRRREEALRGEQAGHAGQARRAGNDAALHRALAAAGHLRQQADQLRRRPEGREVARLQPGHRAHRRARRRAAGHGAGRRAVAGDGHRRDRELHVVGLDRLRHQDLRAHQVLVRHPGLAAEERGARQQGRLRRARQADPGRRAEGRRRRGDARLGAVAAEERRVHRPAEEERHARSCRRRRS